MHENIKRYLHGITEALSSSKNKTFGTIHLLQIKQTEKHLHRELQKVGKPTSLIDADDFHYSSRYRSILSKIVEDGQDFSGKRSSVYLSLSLSFKHRSFERSWEIFWQPKWVSVSTVDVEVDPLVAGRLSAVS